MNRTILRQFTLAPGQFVTPTFVQFAQTLWDGKYTGSTLVHWLHGRPRKIDFPVEGATIAIDCEPKPVHSQRDSVK